jgi:hypothetical protein
MYSYQEQGQVAEVQDITWRFTGTGYLMTLEGEEVGRVFCDVAGNYTLKNGVTMEETNANRTNGICDKGKNPVGQFALISTDEGLLLQQDESGIFRTIELTFK